MVLQLGGRFEFAPILLRKVFPNRPYLHELSVIEMSELIGWPVKKTRNFFGGHKNPNWEDITHISNALSIPIEEIVLGMARYMIPNWQEEQEKYLKSLKSLHRSKSTTVPKEYGKTLYNLINGRYPVELQ